MNYHKKTIQPNSDFNTLFSSTLFTYISMRLLGFSVLLMAQLIWCDRRYLSGNDNKARRVCTCVCDSDFCLHSKTPFT